MEERKEIWANQHFHFVWNAEGHQRRNYVQSLLNMKGRWTDETQSLLQTFEHKLCDEDPTLNTISLNKTKQISFSRSHFKLNPSVAMKSSEKLNQFSLISAVILFLN